MSDFRDVLHAECKSQFAARDAEIAKLKREVANLEVVGVHTCHEHCKNWLCLIRRGNDDLKAKLDKAKASLDAGRRYLEGCGYGSPEADAGEPEVQMLHDFERTLAAISGSGDDGKT